MYLLDRVNCSQPGKPGARGLARFKKFSDLGDLDSRSLRPRPCPGGVTGEKSQWLYFVHRSVQGES